MEQGIFWRKEIAILKSDKSSSNFASSKGTALQTFAKLVGLKTHR